MDDLCAKIRIEIERRISIARGATPGPWTPSNRSVNAPDRMVVASVAARELWPTAADADHIALHDPADAIRRYERDLDLLRQYADLDAEGEGRLTHDEIVERCAQLELLRDLIADLAESLGIDTGGQP